MEFEVFNKKFQALSRGVLMVLAVLLVLVANPGHGVNLADHFSEQSGLEHWPARLFRMDIDVTGDGLDEIFLAHSQTWTKPGWWSSGGFQWYVYSPQSEGESLSYLGWLVFNQYGVRYDPNAGTLHVTESDAPDVDDRGVVIATYRFDIDGMQLVERSARLEPEHPQIKAEVRAQEEWRLSRSGLQIFFLQFEPGLDWSKAKWRRHDISEAVKEAGDLFSRKVIPPQSSSRPRIH